MPILAILLVGCPEPTVVQEAPEKDDKAPGANDVKAPDDALCFKAAGIVEGALSGTVHAEQYKPEAWKAECEENLKGAKTDQWRAYYGCIIDVGDKSYVAKCANRSPPPF